MHYSEVAENVKALIRNLPEPSEFVYAFLEAYGTPQANLARLKSGPMNLAKVEGELLFKKKLYFKPTEGDLFAALDALKSGKGTQSNDPRFLLVTDFKLVLALDRKTGDTLDCKIADLDGTFDFFLPLAGMEKTKLSNENPADRKAAERMAKLFDAIRLHNPEFVDENSHAMNVFLARLLFCFFAEDTGIFEENAISNAIASHTAADASDLHDFFVRLFDILDRKSRAGLPQHLKELPYVNGGLFKDHFPIPEFSMKARRMMLEAGELTWADINPDIFGSMFQAVIDPEERHNLGQHYTSVTNIMKVIEPLFLNGFREAFDKASSLQRGKSQALHRLLERIAQVKIFDPACGSGNFLIIAYKELRRLEMDIFQELQKETGELPLSGLKVSQFYGIEISDFAAETAVLALRLTEHQMNLESKRVCGQAPNNLPLRDGAHIKCANACRIDWETVCPKETGDEIYILGNPPYKGSRVQTKAQKSDMALAFHGITRFKDLDYVSCWFIKATNFLAPNIQFAFVTTNSLCQGTQVTDLWPALLSEGIEISFAYKSFKWANNAKNKAGVTCSIVGLRPSKKSPKHLYVGNTRIAVENINAYLISGADLFVSKRREPLSNIPRMSAGNYTGHAQKLLLSENEKTTLVQKAPKAELFLKRAIGSNELIKGIRRWCIWIEDHDLPEALEIPELKERIEVVAQNRRDCSDKEIHKLIGRAHQFRDTNTTTHQSIVVPTVSSERRNYLTLDFIGKETIVTNKAMILYEAPTYIFGLISSRIHMVWVRAIAGRLETRISYSSILCYNTFPVPRLSDSQKQALTTHVMNVLQERENHPEKTMAQLYDPDKMPDGLRAAHHALDLAVDQLYRKAPFASDEERLEHLFKLYEAMIAAEQKGKK